MHGMLKYSDMSIRRATNTSAETATGTPHSYLLSRARRVKPGTLAMLLLYTSDTYSEKQGDEL